MRLLFIIFYIGSTLAVQAQMKRYVVLMHRNKDKEVVFWQGDLVRVTTIKGEHITGKLEVMNEDMILVKNKIVPLTSIQRIGKRNRFVGAVSSFTLSVGLSLLQSGVSLSLAGDAASEAHRVLKAAVPMLGIGTGSYFIYWPRSRKKWIYEGVIVSW